jgi:hypothetical protein
MKQMLTLGAILALANSPIILRAEEHNHIGPHKGAIVEWGDEEYHLEVVTDSKEGTVSVYVYGGEDDLKAGKGKYLSTPSLVMTVKADTAVTLKLFATPRKGDPAGMVSLYMGKHDIFKTDAKLSGTVSGKVGTKPYSADFKQK